MTSLSRRLDKLERERTARKGAGKLPVIFANDWRPGAECITVAEAERRAAELGGRAIIVRYVRDWRGDPTAAVS